MTKDWARAAAGASLALLTVLGVLGVLAGCGTQQAGAVGRATPSAPAQAAQPTASLTIQVTQAPGSTAQRWTLRCGPPGGSLPGAPSACAAIARTSDPFGPVPHGTMCSMIDSGPQTAVVAGTWDGKAVDATYSRVNSCQTARWNRLAALFPAAVTPGPTAPGGGQVNPGGPMLPGPSKSASGTSGGSGGMSGGSGGMSG